MRKRTSEGKRRTGNAVPRSRFSTVSATTGGTYPPSQTEGTRSSRGRSLDSSALTRSAFFIGPVSSRLVTSRACDSRVKGRRVPPRSWRQDGGVCGSGMFEVAARCRAVAKQVQLLGDLRGGGRGQTGVWREESFLCRGLALRRARVET